MQPLNLRTPKPFDYSSEVATAKRRAKFYCISEGPTEESYFIGVKNNKRKLKIKNDVYIEVIEKAEGQECFSHPEQLIKACLVVLGRKDMEGNDIDEKEWEKNCKWDFNPQEDYACVIFDRDYRGLENYLPNLLETCKRHNIYVALSNPNFELWLLMHFPNIEKYDKDKLLCNPKNLRNEIFPNYSKHKKYLEIVLSIVAGGYRKGCKINFEHYVDGVQLAIEQAELFCKEPDKLVNELGSSVGSLIQEMQK